MLSDERAKVESDLLAAGNARFRLAGRCSSIALGG